jgi:hypothetical protein
MDHIDTIKALLATLRQALYQYDPHLAATVLHIETLLDDPGKSPPVE